jgi:hypothetical protein
MVEKVVAVVGWAQDSEVVCADRDVKAGWLAGAGEC